MLYANVFNFHVYKTFSSGYASCLIQWGSAMPSPDSAIIPNSLIHILIFFPLSSLYDKQNIISVIPKYLESAQLPFENTECPGDGTQKSVFKNLHW